jgi:hypothetical protein
VSQVVQPDYQIIDHLTAAAHSVPCDDDDRKIYFSQMAESSSNVLDGYRRLAVAQAPLATVLFDPL